VRPSQRAGERDRDPEDAGRRILDRLAFPDERERDEHARRREEQRRRQHFPAARFDREILPQHEPRRAQA
jgi:hypothetical protein